jgi:hypothetical protein
MRTAESNDRHHPFHCGTQYLDWENRNCCRCAKYSDDASKCDLMQALAQACFDDGTVSTDVAGRIGLLDALAGGRSPYLWDCKEREAVGGNA